MALQVAIVTLLVCTTSAGSGAPQSGDGASPSQDRTHAVTLEDYFTLGLVTAVEASPDGRRVLFLFARWEKDLDRRNPDIWVAREGEAPRRLTWSDASEKAIAWHPNGKEILFIRPHKGKPQIWRMAVDGGEARPVTAAKGGVEAYRITHDGKGIYYTTRQRATIGDWDWFKRKYDKLRYGSGIWRLGQIWWRDLEGESKPRKILGGDYHIAGFDVSRDGRRLAFVKTPDPRLIQREGWSDVMVLDLQTGASTKIPDDLWRKEAASPYGWTEGPVWSANGEALAFTVSWDGYPTEIYIAHAPFDGTGRVEAIPRPQGPEVQGGTVRWSALPGEILFRAQDRTRSRLFRAQAIQGPRRPSPVEPITPEAAQVWSFSAPPGGEQIYLVLSLVDRHQDIYSLDLSPEAGSAERVSRVTDLDPQVATWILPETRVVRWTGWNGDEVEGVLSLPAGYDGKEPIPTIVMIHGGPGAASLSVFNYWVSEPVPLYAARGWAVFRPNYRGSVGYGDRFHSDLIGHKNDRDVADIVAGIDYLVGEGIADPKRLAVNGWSNGGSLTNWLVVSSPDLFQGASSGAGVADFILQFGLEDTPGHVINYSEGFPWETWESLMRRSPLVQAHRVKTPVLFLVGEKDARVPAAHARAFHRSLRYVGVPTELIIFPGEGHGLDRMTHRRAKIEMEYAWFEKYVLGKDPTPTDPPAE